MCRQLAVPSYPDNRLAITFLAMYMQYVIKTCFQKHNLLWKAKAEQKLSFSEMLYFSDLFFIIHWHMRNMWVYSLSIKKLPYSLFILKHI